MGFIFQKFHFAPNTSRLTVSLFLIHGSQKGPFFSVERLDYIKMENLGNILLLTKNKNKERKRSNGDYSLNINNKLFGCKKYVSIMFKAFVVPGLGLLNVKVCIYLPRGI